MTCENDTDVGTRVLVDCGLEELPTSLPYHTLLIHIHGSRALFFR